MEYKYENQKGFPCLGGQLSAYFVANDYRESITVLYWGFHYLGTGCPPTWIGLLKLLKLAVNTFNLLNNPTDRSHKFNFGK